MVKKQTIVALVENPSLSEDTSSAKGIDKAEYKKSSHECMKRFLSIAAPDTSMAGYVSRIIKDHIAENATTINKIFEDSKTKLF